MRVLLVVPALGAVYGGPSKISPALAAALARCGLEVDLITTNADGPAHDLDQPLDRWIEQPGGWRLRVFRRNGTSEFKPSLPLVSWLLLHAGQYGAAHLTSDFNFPVLAAALACRLRRTPYILNPQGMLEPWALAYKAPKKAAFYRWIERPLVLNGARALQALNANEAANLARLAIGPRIFTAANGIDIDEAETAASKTHFYEQFPEMKDRRIILFLHRVDPKKGLDVLAKAYAAIQKSIENVHLVVAGPETEGYGPQARRLFEEAGCSADSLTFTGSLQGETKRAALAVAEVFVAPTYSEGFSMAVLEAMAAGLPCALTTGCNFPEAKAAGAALEVPIGNGPAFAEILLTLLLDRSAARKMGERARAFVLANYTWDHVAQHIAEELRSVARRSPHPH